MTSPFVVTKVYVPRPARTLVPRARLSSLLRSGTDARLTVVSAPAGFGKTTAVSAWLAESDDPELRVAWVSLEEDDDSSSSFWTCVVAAVRSVGPTSAPT